MTKTVAEIREYLLSRTGNHAEDIREANEIADEIERLAAESEARHQSCLVLMKSVNEHRAEIARLRAYLVAIADGAHEGAHQTWIKSMANGALRGDPILVGQPGSWRQLPPDEPSAGLEPCPTCGKLGTPPPLEDWQLRALKSGGGT